MMWRPDPPEKIAHLDVDVTARADGYAVLWDDGEQEHIYGPAGGGGGPTLLVAADDASAKAKAAADYICDGTDDHVQIEAAIGDLPTAGGTVLLSEGTFNVTNLDASVSNLLLRGMGTATVLRLPDSHGSGVDVLRVYGSSGTPIVGTWIADLVVDGNKANSSGGGQKEGVDLNWTRQCGIVRVVARNCVQDGIDLDDSRDCWVLSCLVHDNDGFGIHLGGDTGTENRRALILHNVAHGNGDGARGGIDQNIFSHDSVFLGNVAYDNYRNFEIRGSGATWIANKSLGTTTEADILTGVTDLGGGADLSTYPSADGQPAGKVAETDGADGWTFIDTPTGGVWLPLTTVVAGEPELVWGDNDSLIPTEVPT